MRSRTGVGALTMRTALLVAALLIAEPASGAQPLRQARYAGAAGQIVAAVQVSRGADALTSARGGSHLKVNSLAFDPVCLKRPYLALVGRGRRVPVDRSGRFSIRRRFDGNTLRAHGRFLTPYTARLVFRVRPASGFPCEPGPQVVMLHPEGVDPPFSGCRSQRATTLLENEDARIFNQRKVFYGYYFVPVAYGCLFSVNKRFELGLDDPVAPTGDSESSDARDFQLAGPYTAYVLQYIGAVMGGDVVSVVDLRDGTRVTPGSGGPVVVRSLVLKDNGSIAWIQNDHYSREEQVWVHDALGDRKIDSAPARESSLPITSLQLADSVLTWLHDGERRSATLY